ncbi:MAG: hypothetical protein II551_08645 [Paludibacteraceae bacterium]|nr:hypothetical protein [Paludibacteraceae bacterium]
MDEEKADYSRRQYEESKPALDAGLKEEREGRMIHKEFYVSPKLARRTYSFKCPLDILGAPNSLHGKMDEAKAD